MRGLAASAAVLLALPVALALAADGSRQSSSFTLTQTQPASPTGEHFVFDYVNPDDPAAKPPAVRRVGCYCGYTASGGPVGVGRATAKSMVLNTVMVHLVGMVGTQVFWGTNPRAPIGG